LPDPTTEIYLFRLVLVFGVTSQRQGLLGFQRGFYLVRRKFFYPGFMEASTVIAGLQD
jgi:hypothetical protein